MMLTLEITPGLEAWLDGEAANHGQSIAAYATQLLRQAAEDARDVASIDRILAESEPTERRILAELLAEVVGDREAAVA